MSRRARARAHSRKERAEPRSYVWTTLLLTAAVALWRRYLGRGYHAGLSADLGGSDRSEHVHPGENNGENGDEDGAASEREEHKEFLSYVWGAGLALLLTLVPFALVHWVAVPRFPLLIVIGAFALVQMLVHFRFFLHISFSQKREDLQLILFSALLLIIMVAGTIWIMASLASRMTMPIQP